MGSWEDDPEKTAIKRNYKVSTSQGSFTIQDIISISWESEPGLIMFYDSGVAGSLPVLIAPLRDTVVSEEVK